MERIDIDKTLELSISKNKSIFLSKLGSENIIITNFRVVFTLGLGIEFVSYIEKLDNWFVFNLQDWEFTKDETLTDKLKRKLQHYFNRNIILDFDTIKADKIGEVIKSYVEKELFG